MPTPSPLAAVAQRARVQHGLIERSHALELGLTASTLQRWLVDGRLEKVFPGVYRAAGSPRTGEQRLLAAVLAAGPGAAASHRSAASLWGLLERTSDAVEVSVPRERLPRLGGVVVHRSSDLALPDLSVRQGITVTNPLRTLVDLGAVVPRSSVEDALDRALTARLVSVPSVESALHRLARRGRRGAGVLRCVLDERALGIERPDGLLEPRMARLLRDHGLPRAVFQHDVRRRGRFLARIDFAYPDRRLAIEVDGFAVHASPRALQRDLARQNALVGEGWTVLRFTWRDVVRGPRDVAATIREVLGTSASDR